MLSQRLMPPRPFRAAFALAFASAAPAAVVTALLDLIVTAARSGEPIGAGAFVWAAIAALGLYGAFGAFIAAGEAIVGGGLSATLDLGPSLRRFVDGARPHAAYDRGAAAGIAVLALALGVVGAIVLGYDRAIAMQMAA